MSDQPIYVTKHKEYLKRYYLEHKEIIKARSAARHLVKRDEILAKNRAKTIARLQMEGKPSRRKLKLLLDSKYKEYRKKYYLEYQTEEVIKIRYRALQKISSRAIPECEKCGQKDWRALEINHINGGGGKEAKEKGFRRMALEIIKGTRGISDLNVLCAGCNKIYEYERGKRRLPENYQEIIDKEIASWRASSQA